MDIHGLPGHPGYGLHHRETVGKIRDQDAVHYVEMEDVGIVIHHFHILCKMQKIGGKH